MLINVSKGRNNYIMLLVKDERSFLDIEDAVETSTKMIEALNSILTIDQDTKLDYKVEIDLNAPYCADDNERR